MGESPSWVDAHFGGVALPPGRVFSRIEKKAVGVRGRTVGGLSRKVQSSRLDPACLSVDWELAVSCVVRS